MIALAPAVQHAARALTVKPCANGDCRSQAWQVLTRRGRGIRLNNDWYCSDECLHSALAAFIQNLPRFSPEVYPRVHRLPLGLLMLSRSIVDESQLRAALRIQSEHPDMKIGQCLERIGSVNEDDITRALGAQQSLPVLLAVQPEIDTRVPESLLHAAHCILVRGNYNRSVLYLGFDGAIDRSLVSAAEVILRCHCEPCIVSTAMIDQHLETRSRDKNPGEIAFQTRCSDTELNRTIFSYVNQLRAEAIRIARTRRHLWVSLAGARHLDLTFPVA